MTVQQWNLSLTLYATSRNLGRSLFKQAQWSNFAERLSKVCHEIVAADRTEASVLWTSLRYAIIDTSQDL